MIEVNHIFSAQFWGINQDGTGGFTTKQRHEEGSNSMHAPRFRGTSLCLCVLVFQFPGVLFGESTRAQSPLWLKIARRSRRPLWATALSSIGYRLRRVRRLPSGWSLRSQSPAPPDIWLTKFYAAMTPFGVVSCKLTPCEQCFFFSASPCWPRA